MGSVILYKVCNTIRLIKSLFFSIYTSYPNKFNSSGKWPCYVSNFRIFPPSTGMLLQETLWGSITLIDAERRLLANALLDFSNERFILLSESCIPIYNFQTIYKYLTNSMHSFVESYDENTLQGRGRYNRKMWPNIRLPDWRKGSQWFELNRELAVNIISDYKYYNLFKNYCKPSCYPDEHYIPTYLNMFYGPLNSNRTVTWVDWSRGGPHPVGFGKESVTEEFIKGIRHNATACAYNFRKTTVCYLFARKFTPSALEPLLLLSNSLMDF